ncbi:MAG TPA: DUF4384 domain-containing protein [Syntrophobacteraceae bacterium]|nr:DUF4384 domain-containing protein [Syntrophobacteraceae bacterium]
MFFYNGKGPLRRALQYFGLLLLPALFLWWPMISCGAEGQDLVKFRWAFAALKQDGTDLRVESIGNRLALKSEDQLKMMVELESNCFVYVIHHSSQGAFTLMFPYSLKQLSDDYQQRRKYFIPDGDRWFELDQHTGYETFYLLASPRRQENLERLLQQYESTEPSKRAQVSAQLLDEISTLKQQHRQLASAAERPESIGGAVRGFEKAQGMNPPDISVIAREISAQGFFARTFTIDHQ